jgi:2-dehydropantoate 2-reductase
MIAQNKKIAILGAGSLGSVIGGLLAEAGHEVCLICRNQAHVDAINANGLMLRAGGVYRCIQVLAVTQCHQVDVSKHDLDLLIVLVKSFDTETAIQAALPLIGPKTVVLSLQNGVGHETILGRAVGVEKILIGKTYVGGFIIAPGVVIDGSTGKETVMGEVNGSVSQRSQAIASVFSAAGLLTHATANIMSSVWDKLLVNTATGAVSAISGLPYGLLYEQAALTEVALAAVAEGMAVAKALGVPIGFSNPSQPWLKAGAGLPREFKPSMLQSLEKGSTTEIDFINGAIVELGKEYGVPTPVNATLVACIKALESKLSLNF